MIGTYKGSLFLVSEGFTQPLKKVPQSIVLQATTGLADTVLADKLSKKRTVLEEKLLVLYTGFEDTTAWEDKIGLTVFFR